MDKVSLAKCYIEKARTSAERNKSFELSITTFANIKAQSVCAYSGLPFSKKHPFSFERIDNSIGYVDGNVIPVSAVLNNLRSSLTEEQILELITKTELWITNVENRVAKVKAKNKHVQDQATKAFKSASKPMLNTVRQKKWFAIIKLINDADKRIKHSQTVIEDFKSKLEALKASNKKNRKEKIKNLTNAIEIQENKLSKSILAKQEEERRLINFYSNCKLVKPKYRLNQVEFAKTIVLTDTQDDEKLLCDLREKVENYKLVLVGINKFKKLGKMDTLRIKLGLSLDTPMSVVLKHKMAYNLLGGNLV